MIVDRHEGGGRESRVLAGIVTDTALLAQLAPKWTDGLLSSPWASIIASWAIRHYLQYGTAPGKAIAGYYEAWAETSPDRATVELVGQFLRSVSDRADADGEQPTDFLRDLALTHFDIVRAERLADLVKADIAMGDVEKAKARIAAFSGFQLTANAGVDVFSDFTALDRAFTNKSTPIVEYPGSLGSMLNPAMVRDALVAFMAPKKRGKSFWLMDVAWEAVMQRRRVAFFSVGDMSEGQMLMRLGTRAAMRPAESHRWPCRVRVPRSITLPSGSPLCEVVYDEEEFDSPLSQAEAEAAFAHVQSRRVRSTTSYFKLYTFPNSSISVKGVESALLEQDRLGWSADVVCIDYADILAPVDRKEDKIERVNQTWKALRALSQSRHCLVVTASQTSKESYGVDLIRDIHGTEFRGKFDHLTAAFGINQCEEEKDRQLMRINCLAAREFDFNPSRVVHVAGAVALGCPAIVSCQGA